MARTSQLLVLAALSLGPSSAIASDTVPFPAGSLIIPMQGSYQSACGTTSAYGLVWRILQANQKGHFFNAKPGDTPVTVYWVIDEGKKSPNRCVPNNLLSNPSGGPWDDATWNDGCDVTELKNDTQQPVVPVDYAKDWPAGNIYAPGVIKMFNTSTDCSGEATCIEARPAFDAVKLDDTTPSSGPRFTNIHYGGGPFIISALDAPRVIAFLKTGDDYVKPGTGTTGALSRFTTACDCSFNPPDPEPPEVKVLCNYVNMHQATIQFNAPVSKRINKVPPKIALLASATNSTVVPVQDPPLGGLPIDVITNPDGRKKKIYNQILVHYLQNAGLWGDDAAGCPKGSLAPCNETSTSPGLIYDVFDANTDLISTDDYPHGLLNKDDPADPSGNTPLYRVFWTPHWEAFDTTNEKYNGDRKVTSERENALNNIAFFASRANTGLMAECASLESYESSFSGGSIAIPKYTSATHFQYTDGIKINGLSVDENSWDARNCSDPDYDHGSKSECSFYPSPGNPFSQIGDFHFTATRGHVHQYRPNDGSAKQEGVGDLALSWLAAKGAEDYKDGGTGDNGWTFFSVRKYLNPTTKLAGATVLYLAGHDYSSSVAGNRIVLNTLLNLGGDPQAAERAVAPPVAFNDLNGNDSDGTRSLVLQGTFLAVSGYDSDVRSFTATAGKRWVFPYLPGDLRAHSLVGGANLATTGTNELDRKGLWDADAQMPKPGDRNLFTYFGGVIGPVDSSGSVGNFGLTTRHPVLQTGWKVQSIKSDMIRDDATTSDCVDELSLAKDSGKFHFVPGQDGVCDLQEALEYTAMPAASGVSAVKDSMKSDFTTVQQLIQRVRGFCWATSSSGTAVMEPKDDECDPGAVSISTPATTLLPNRAHIGGIVHSSPVVVGKSPFVVDAPDKDGKPSFRPTVAYFGGYDGQLHAVYVSGGNYNGSGSVSYPPGSQKASEKFKTDWATSFKSGQPASGTELWSFIPASQLPLLKSNAARLDSAPLVQDVFVDLAGKGYREWHTVLVMSVGGSGREVFAMDVTNPLEPVLLWDLVGSRASGSQLSANIPATAADVMDGGTVVPTSFSFKWVNGTTHYVGENGERSRLFDYSDLGAASGISLAQLRQGLDPVYVAFVTTNASGVNTNKAVEVFAIDIASGQKIWQWESPYSTSFTDNTVPPPPTIFNIAPDLPRVYVPDMEGKIWELDANTGVNVNFHDGLMNPIPGCTTGSPCSIALLNDGSTSTAPQPITTNIAVARVPDTVDAGSLFKGFEGARLLIAGTAGADWVGSGVDGKLYALLLDAHFRKPIAAGGSMLDGTTLSQAEALTSATDDGLLQSPTGLPITLTNMHLYGPVTVAGQRIFFESAPPQMKLNDPLDLVGLPADLSGGTYFIQEGTATSVPTLLFKDKKASFGGTTVLVASDGIYTIATEVNSIAVTKDLLPTTADPTAGGLAPQSQLNPDQSLPYRLMNWLRRKLQP